MKDVINNLIYELSNELNSCLELKENKAEFFKTVSCLYEKFEELYEYLEDFSDAFQVDDDLMADFADLLMNDLTYDNANRSLNMMGSILDNYLHMTSNIHYFIPVYEGQVVAVSENGVLKPGAYEVSSDCQALIRIRKSIERTTIICPLDNATMVELHLNDVVEVYRGKIRVRNVE